jgi:hypothetical protein
MVILSRKSAALRHVNGPRPPGRPSGFVGFLAVQVWFATCCRCCFACFSSSLQFLMPVTLKQLELNSTILSRVAEGGKPVFHLEALCAVVELHVGSVVSSDIVAMRNCLVSLVGEMVCLRAKVVRLSLRAGSLLSVDVLLDVLQFPVVRA